MQTLEGAPLSSVADTHSALLQRAVAAVGSERMAAAFGVTDIADDGAPNLIYSTRFAYLCESVSETLNLSRRLGQALMSSLQRAARHGAEAITGVCASPVGDADDKRFTEIISSVSAWATALGELAANLEVARAWTEPAYRSGLLPLERDLLPPHPAGEISLEGTVKTAEARFSSGPLGYSTQTVIDVICCCTGDVPGGCGPSGTYAVVVCPPETNGVCCPDTGTEDPTLTGILA